MPTLRPRKRARASSSSLPRLSPATATAPESARSNPAITISSVDLPEPDGPTKPIASPPPILRLMSLRIWTRAAPCPSERLTPASDIAGAAWELLVIVFHPAQPRSYGTFMAQVQRLAAIVLVASFCGSATAAEPVKIVVLGDSLSAGYGLPAGAAFPERLALALKAKGKNIA